MSIGKTLQVLADLLRDLPPDEPLTAGKLCELVEVAAEDAKQDAYEAYMGEDL